MKIIYKIRLKLPYFNSKTLNYLSFPLYLHTLNKILIMKYYFLLILRAFFISCSDDSDPIVVQTDEDIVQYLTQNNIATVKSNTGLRYSIVNNGNGKFPTENAKVTLSYKASLLDGTVFEESDEEGITLLLHNLIPGLKEGLQYFDEGSEGLIFIPPALGFGNFTRNGVPAGSVLIFEIKILKVIEADDEILQYLSENELTAEKSKNAVKSKKPYFFILFLDYKFKLI